MPLRLTTLLSRNPKLIEQHVRQLADYYAGNNLLCLFTLSASDSVDWTSCWRQLRRIAGEGKIENVVGCLSSPLNNVGSKEDGKNLSELLSCSIGIFEPDEAVAFRSQIPGDRQPQVGRWHSFRKHPEEAPWNESMSFEENISWENVWKQGQDDGAIPLDLQGARPEEISAFLYLTDRSYQGLARSLTRHYPNASKLGLVAPSTLTVNELPSTLLYGDKPYSEGAVGLALKRSSASYASGLNFHGVQAISPSMTITGSNGNIVESINNTNPTQLLLAALEKVDSGDKTSPSYSPMQQFLHERIFLGVQDSAGRPSRMYQISAGDPSRGPLSLMADQAPSSGSTAQFFLRPDTSLFSISTAHSSPQQSIEFVTVQEILSTVEPDLNDEAIHTLENRFVAASDAGVVMHGKGSQVESVALGCPVGTHVRLDRA